MLRWLRKLLGRPPQARRPDERPGRNDPCRCGSGHKYKSCCLPHDAEHASRSDRERRASAENAPLSGVITGEHEEP